VDIDENEMAQQCSDNGFVFVAHEIEIGFHAVNYRIGSGRNMTGAS
jgi:hypothetical protein